VVDDEELSLDGTAFEFAMLALRLSEGFSLNEYREKFGVDFLDRRKEIISRLADVGYLITDGGRIRLTERGFYVSNSILGELLLGY
jgi:oxygen-independent coproporphyrinogen-3 oxidase